MSKIKKSCIEEIRRRVSLYDVVAPYVSLKRMGSSWRGLSPFTQEKTPSFFVNPEKNIFKCFSSNYGGDIFRFVQLKENLSFSESIEWLARKFNILLEYEAGDSHEGERESVKKELFAIHEIAVDFYRRQFWSSSSAGQFIRNYWEKERHFLLETAKAFSIGFAPPQDTQLLDICVKKGLSLEALRQCGLFYAREGITDPRRFRLRFRGRLMIPVRDIQGRVVAFSGRKLTITPSDDPSVEAKYINSPETPIFHKGGLLFNLDRARQHINETKPLLIVEGQLDTLRCCEQGIETVVAPQGTSITDHQLSTIRRYTRKIECLLDGDSAGQRAALRLLPMAFKAGLEVRFLVLPKEHDPDSLLREQGKAALEVLQKNADSPMVFLKKSLTPQERACSPHEKSEFLGKLYEILQQCDSAVEQREYLREACALLQVDYGAAAADFGHFLKFQRKGTSSTVPKAPPVQNEGRLLVAEEELLRIFLRYESLSQPLAALLDTEWIDGKTVAERLLVRFIESVKEGMWEGVAQIENFLEAAEERDLVYTLLVDQTVMDSPVAAANHCIKSIYTNHIRRRIAEVEDQMSTELQKAPSTLSQALRPLQEARMQLRQLLQKVPTLNCNP